MFEVPQISQPDEGEFPNGPTKRGRYYMTKSPHDEELVIMSMDTWADFGTKLETFRQVAKSQDTRIKELIASVAAAGLAKNEMEKKLNNLRDVRRAEKRADLGDFSSDAPAKLYVPPAIKGR